MDYKGFFIPLTFRWILYTRAHFTTAGNLRTHYWIQWQFGLNRFRRNTNTGPFSKRPWQGSTRSSEPDRRASCLYANKTIPHVFFPCVPHTNSLKPRFYVSIWICTYMCISLFTYAPLRLCAGPLLNMEREIYGHVQKHDIQTQNKQRWQPAAGSGVRRGDVGG